MPPAGRRDPATRAVIDLLTRFPAGSRVLLCLDGRSGAGKTALAGAVARAWAAWPASPGPAAPTVAVVHLDDAYPGWEGLRAGVEAVADGVVTPWRAGRAGLLPRWDWSRNRPGQVLTVPPADLLVVEGCGAALTAPRPAGAGTRVLRVLLVAPEAERLARATARDGESLRAHWDRWRAQEDEVLAAPAAACFDLEIDTGTPVRDPLPRSR